MYHAIIIKKAGKPKCSVCVLADFAPVKTRSLNNETNQQMEVLVILKAKEGNGAKLFEC